MGTFPIKFFKGSTMTIQVYACGGTGTAAAARLANTMSTFSEGRNILIADTSDSNIRDGQFPNVFLLDKMESEYDGSGSLRKQNVDNIKNQVPQLLDKHPPQKYNIVISSGGGGSGSVFAPFIAQQILEQNKICFIIITNNSASLKTMENTVNTHKSYIAMNKGKCIPMFVVDNTDVKRADAMVDYIVSAIDTLVNSKNYGLDGSDIYNFLNWSRVTDQTPGPAIITVVKDSVPADIKNIISTLTLSTEMKEPKFDFIPEYTAFGVYDKTIVNQDTTPDTHFIISKTEYAKMLEALTTNLEKEKSRIKNIKNAQSSRDEHNYGIGDSDEIVL